MTKAVCLLSGGLDSTTTLAFARREGFECYALSFDYGQRHSVELKAAQRVSQALGVAEHRIAHVDLRAFGGSALTADIAVPKNRDSDEMSRGIPITYVPARNTIFLSFALAYAEVSGRPTSSSASMRVDYSGYPDCRPEFIDAFEHIANLATKAGVEGRTRLDSHAADPSVQGRIIRLASELSVDFSLTHSCYDPDPEGRPAAPATLPDSPPDSASQASPIPCA